VVAVQGIELRVGDMRPDMPLAAPRPRTASDVEPHLPPLAAFEQPSPRQFVPTLSQDTDSSDDERGVGGVRLAPSPKPGSADALEPYTASPAPSPVPALVTADSLPSPDVPVSAFVPPRARRVPATGTKGSEADTERRHSYFYGGDGAAEDDDDEGDGDAVEAVAVQGTPAVEMAVLPTDSPYAGARTPMTAPRRPLRDTAHRRRSLSVMDAADEEEAEGPPPALARPAAASAAAAASKAVPLAPGLARPSEAFLAVPAPRGRRTDDSQSDRSSQASGKRLLPTASDVSDTDPRAPSPASALKTRELRRRRSLGVMDVLGDGLSDED
jgi:hypothetical protein